MNAYVDLFLKKGTLRLPVAFEIRDGALRGTAHGMCGFTSKVPQPTFMQAVGSDGIRFGPPGYATLNVSKVYAGDPITCEGTLTVPGRR